MSKVIIRKQQKEDKDETERLGRELEKQREKDEQISEKLKQRREPHAG